MVLRAMPPVCRRPNTIGNECGPSLVPSGGGCPSPIPCFRGEERVDPLDSRASKCFGLRWAPERGTRYGRSLRRPRVGIVEHSPCP
jgi:hypothetical protein